MHIFTSRITNYCVKSLLLCYVFGGCDEFARAQEFWGNWGGLTNPATSSISSTYQWASATGTGYSGTSPEWKLGVTGSNTDVGVYVRQVELNSSAMRAGIGVGDTIICVANNQVGQRGNQVFDLGQAIAREADIYGRVRILL